MEQHLRKLLCCFLCGYKCEIFPALWGNYQIHTRNIKYHKNIARMDYN